jgi:hypothetical protein
MQAPSSPPQSSKKGRPPKATLAALQAEIIDLRAQVQALSVAPAIAVDEANDVDDADVPEGGVSLASLHGGAPVKLSRAAGLTIATTGGALAVSFLFDSAAPTKKFPSSQFKDLLPRLNVKAHAVAVADRAGRVSALLQFLRELDSLLVAVDALTPAHANFALSLLDDKARRAVDLDNVRHERLLATLLERANNVCRVTSVSALRSSFYSLARAKGETTLQLWDRCYREADVLLLIGALDEQELCAHLCELAVRGKECSATLGMTILRVRDLAPQSFGELRAAWTANRGEEQDALLPKAVTGGVRGRERGPNELHSKEPSRDRFKTPPMDHSQPCKSSRCTDPTGQAHAWWSCGSFICHKCKKPAPGHDARNCPDFGQAKGH